MNAREYESFVYDLVRRVKPFSEGTISRNRRFDGVRQPGKYEIDIAIEFLLGVVGIPIFLIIECQNQQRPIDRPVVQKLAQTKDAISADKAVLASPVGFTKEAVKVAETLGIELWTIPEDYRDWGTSMSDVAQDFGVEVHEYFEARHDGAYEIPEHTPPLVIRTAVQMYLLDYKLYASAGFPSLDRWIGNTLDDAIRTITFGKSYEDLLTSFEVIEKATEDHVRGKAQKIGYGIKRLISVPDLAPYQWLDDFRLEVEDAFETSVPGFIVRLGVDVVTRLSQLENVAGHIRREEDIPSLIKKNIINEIRTVLHKISPERYFMRFSFTTEENEEPVEEILIDRITKRLTEEFGADVISIAIKMLETEVTKTWSKLETGEAHLEFDSRLFDVDDVTFAGSFRVNSIHSSGWSTFLKTKPDLDMVRFELERYLATAVGALPLDVVGHLDDEGRRQVLRLIESMAKEFALKEFGLVIRVDVREGNVDLTKLGTAIDIDSLCQTVVKALRATLRSVRMFVDAYPQEAFQEVWMLTDRRWALRVELLAETQFSAALLDKCSYVVHLSAESLDSPSENAPLDLWEQDGVFALVDMISGTDLLERGMSSSCCLFQPSAPKGSRILGSFVGMSSGEICYSASTMPGVRKKPSGHEAELPIGGCSSVVSLADASVCFDGQRADTLGAMLGTSNQPNVLLEFAQTLGPESKFRISNNAGIPMILKLIDHRIKEVRNIDAVFELSGQAPHSAVPGLYLALKGGGATVRKLWRDQVTRKARWTPVTIEELEEALMLPARSRLQYVIAATTALADELTALLLQLLPVSR